MVAFTTASRVPSGAVRIVLTSVIVTGGRPRRAGTASWGRTEAESLRGDKAAAAPATVPRDIHCRTSRRSIPSLPRTSRASIFDGEGARLIQLPFDRRYGLAGAFVIRTDLERPLELFDGLR